MRLCQFFRHGTAAENIYISCIYLGQSGIVKPTIFIDEKDVPERELFPARAATLLEATLRKGQRGLPVFLDELNDALEAHDVEEYGRIAGALRALLARHDDKGGSGALSLTQAR